MKLRSYLSTGVVAGSFVLAGSMALAQTATGAANAQKDKSSSGRTLAQPAVVPGDSANGSAAVQKKHIANVKYNDFKVQQSVKPQTGPGASPVDGAKIKSHSNQTNNREAQPAPGVSPVDVARVKSHSNQSNNREVQTGPGASPVDAARVKSHSSQTNNREAQPAPVNGAGESAKPR